MAVYHAGLAYHGPVTLAKIQAACQVTRLVSWMCGAS